MIKVFATLTVNIKKSANPETRHQISMREQPLWPLVSGLWTLLASQAILFCLTLSALIGIGFDKEK